MFNVAKNKYYSAEVRKEQSGTVYFILWEFDLFHESCNRAIYINLDNPHIVYTEKQVQEMTQRLKTELLSNDNYANGALAAFFASYDCYGQTEYKPIAKLANNRDTDDQHHAWMLHSLMALTETAWA